MTGRRAEHFIIISIAIFFIFLMIIPSTHTNKATAQFAISKEHTTGCPRNTPNSAGTWEIWASGTANTFYDYVGSSNPLPSVGNVYGYATSANFNYGIYYPTPSPPWYNQTLPPINATIDRVWAVVVTHNAESINSGWLSVLINNSQTHLGSYPWLDSSYQPLPWVNSSIFPYYHQYHAGNDLYALLQIVNNPHPLINWNSSLAVGHIFNITNQYNWTPDLLKSNRMQVMWTQVFNETSNIDYVGLIYTWFEITVFTPIYSGESQTTFSGLLWLAIIFMPAMLMAQIAPKIGYTAGLIIMLIILGATQPGFFPVSIIGFASIIITLFKAGGG